jgi:exoribonuclease R
MSCAPRWLWPGQSVGDTVSEAFPRLPAVMAKAEARDGQIERAAIDLAEAAILAGREGESFAAVVTDLGEQGARIQLCDLPVVARVTAHDVVPGARIVVGLDEADTLRRSLRFKRLS